jgi:hypothetical protein
MSTTVNQKLCGQLWVAVFRVTSDNSNTHIQLRHTNSDGCGVCGNH